MSAEFKRVIWRWLPGAVAGLFPLAIFVVVASMTFSAPNGGPAIDRHIGLVNHLLVFGIVTSCVSTFTAFPRLFAYNPGFSPTI